MKVKGKRPEDLQVGGEAWKVQKREKVRAKVEKFPCM
jgi:hypothetical protein